MTSIAYSPVSIQTSSQAAPLPPPWFGEVVLIIAHLRKQGVLDAITQRVRFARRRFRRDVVIDFVAVLFGYAISGERTLEAFSCYSLAACVGTFSTLGPIHTVWIFTNSRMPNQESSRP